MQDKYENERTLFGPLSTISKEEHKEFYETTGIDLDNRMQFMSKFANMAEACITKYIQFAKNIPGFSSLSLDDQAALVKSK